MNLNPGICEACTHPFYLHSDEDGCLGIASYDSETNAYERCHCDRRDNSQAQGLWQMMPQAGEPR